MSPSILSSFPPWSLNQKCVLGMAEGPNQDDTKRGGHSACYLLLQRPKLAEADSDHPAMRPGLAEATCLNYDNPCVQRSSSMPLVVVAVA